MAGKNLQPKVERTKTIAIVAMGLSHQEYVVATALNGGKKLFDEVWAINAMGGTILCDRIFAMDDMDVPGRSNYLDWMPDVAKRIPIYSAHPECCEGLIDYPLEEVINGIGSTYLNTTAAYALAYGIIQPDIAKIALYGMDFTYPDRHAAESGRGCVEFLCAIALTKGIEISVANTSTLLDTNVTKKFYAYKDEIVLEEQDDGHVKVVRKTQEATEGEDHKVVDIAKGA